MAAAVRVCLRFAIFFFGCRRDFIDVYIYRDTDARSNFLGLGLSRVPAGWCISLLHPVPSRFHGFSDYSRPFLC